jgi:transcriptional regulator with PAS, ATPase and Fis domain
MLEHYSTLYPYIDFGCVNPHDPLVGVRKKLQKTTRIFAGRGNTAQEVRLAYPHLHVVDIPITSYDVLRALNASGRKAKTVAVITVYSSILGFDLFAESYGIHLLNHLLTPFDQLRATIQKVWDDGAELIVGGAITKKTAGEMNVPVINFPFGQESMQVVLKEVQHIHNALESEAINKGFISKLLDNTQEGVLAVNGDGKITVFNAVARRILNLQDSILNQPLEVLGKEFSCESDEKENQKIVAIGGDSIILNGVSLTHNNKYVGKIFTLHESRKIEKMEYSFREKTYSRPHAVNYSFADILGGSQAIHRCVEDAKDYARSDANILLRGESGVGKEIFAQSIHGESKRRERPFVAVNCAALPNELLQSELFGYVEGAFTGATRKGKTGLFEMAHGGTLFLDEISEMGYSSQAILLRVIQERCIMRLGSHVPIYVNTRIIAATNRKLEEMVEEGKFRKDLYFRLNVLSLKIPPLRQRKEDIAPLMNHYLNVLPSPFHDGFHLSDGAMECLQQYSWPGNARELRNVAERIAATAKTAEISRRQMLWAMQLTEESLPEVAVERTMARDRKKNSQLEEIRNAVAACGGNFSEAARKLNINRTTLWRRIKRADI